MVNATISYCKRYRVKFIRQLRRHRPDRVQVKKVFFVLSTGRCGTRYIATLLNLAENADVQHEPSPGCEPINPYAYELFLKDRAKFRALRVSNFPTLQEHANLYRLVSSEIFGDCYNSLYPFAIALYHFFQEAGINCQFIHLVRHPFACCSSILRAEGSHAEAYRKNFALRAKLLSISDIPAENASNVWIGINSLIAYEMDYIESLTPGSTKLIRTEDMIVLPKIVALYEWLGLQLPSDEALKRVLADSSYDVKHSHQEYHDQLGIPKITQNEEQIIATMTTPFLEQYGYAPSLPYN